MPFFVKWPFYNLIPAKRLGLSLQLIFQKIFLQIFASFQFEKVAKLEAKSVFRFRHFEGSSNALWRIKKTLQGRIFDFSLLVSLVLILEPKN